MKSKTMLTDDSPKRKANQKLNPAQISSSDTEDTTIIIQWKCSNYRNNDKLN